MPRHALLALMLVLSLPARADDLVVFAAASLTDALQEIGGAYEKETGRHVVFNFGGSSLLARQIREGAPADLFLSADEEKMDGLAGEGLLLPGTRRSVLSNTLAVVVPKGSKLRLGGPGDLASPAVRTVVLAEPSTVPAGIYARQYLRDEGLWSKLGDRIVPTENVRAALAAVAAGNADAGIVYRTDASIDDGVTVAFEVPASEGPPISYPFAVLRRTRDPDRARHFLAFLISRPALEVFRKLGFLVQP
ncbi:MAG TPA: molybdate ABC transporter substrate-binding protein [Candidatus Polarisedimenticolaceae bacterium]|nr:molybdate ABC transporter substrate-binding protein [Candidatus Polarisedimenticolaceae bacterium]